MVTPPIFCAGYRANRSATASAHLPPKYPSCRGVAQDFAKSFRGQHGQPKYLSRRAAVIGKPTKELNGTSPTMLGMRHSSCRRPKRSANGPGGRDDVRRGGILVACARSSTCRPLLHALKTEHSDLSQLAMCRSAQLVFQPRSPSQHWSSRMQEIEGYLRHAAECREMARAASLSNRQQLEQMAETWDELADARKRQLARWGEITEGPTDE